MSGYWVTFARDGAPRAEAEAEAEWRPYGQYRAYKAFEDAPRLRVGPPNGCGLHEAVVCRGCA